MQIDQLDKRDVDAFIQTYAGDYVAEALRADWLRLLARKERWTEFLAEFPKLQQADNDMKCLSLNARRQRPDPQLQNDAQALWRNLSEMGDSCTRAFTLLFEQNLLPESEIWARARQQFELGRYAQAKHTLDFLPKTQHIDASTWSALNNKPENFLRGFFSEREITRPQRELVVLAIQRLGRSNPRDAAQQLKRLTSALPPAERTFLWGQIASAAASQHLPEALEWFAASHPKSLSDEQQRWAVRAALRAGDWPRVNQLINAMPPNLAEEPAWIYWQGRALHKAGKSEAGDALFNKIAGQPHFYGVLATEELGRRAESPPRAASASNKEMIDIAAIGAIQRALAFFKIDGRTEAVREWNWALKNMTDRQLLAAAELARRQHLFDRAINTAEKTVKEHDYTLRYLTPYDEKIRPASKQAMLDEAWVYGLMRQESRFITVAKSSVGAQGLMQLMPGTAKWVAKKLGLKNFHPSQVNDIEINVLLGTSYLRLIYENLDNHPVLASAAYNAGPGRAKRWRDPQKPLEGAIYAESIPFSETRDYVKKVMANAVFYSILLKGNQDSIKTRLGIVAAGSKENASGEDLP